MARIDHRHGALLALILILAAALPAGLAPAADADRSGENLTFNWLSYETARQTSRQERKPLLLLFTRPHCSDCRLLERETFTDRDVRDLVREHFVATRLNPDDFPALQRKYGVEILPTTWFLAPDGRALTSIRGFTTPDRLLSVLQFIATRAYESISWQDWRDGVRPAPPEAESDTTAAPPGDIDIEDLY